MSHLFQEIKSLRVTKTDEIQNEGVKLVLEVPKMIQRWHNTMFTENSFQTKVINEMVRHGLTRIRLKDCIILICLIFANAWLECTEFVITWF